jgi:serine/threonine protein kinase/WD40 repeat protein
MKDPTSDKEPITKPESNAPTLPLGQKENTVPDAYGTTLHALQKETPGMGAEPTDELPIVARELYETHGELARGGLGRILKAHDNRLKRPVALKEILTPSPIAKARFLREAMLTARLEHPAIVPLHEAGRWPSGEPFYAMKLVSGRPLDKVLLEAKTLDERLALLPYLLAVCEAIAYAHSQRIIHRDLKPANVLVGSFGETVVIDWGLAKDLNAGDGEQGTGNESEGEPIAQPSSTPNPSSSGQLTVAGSIMGTPAYMPPEQAAGLPTDERADVYSLGAMLYHLLAGAPPFKAESLHQLLLMVSLEQPQALQKRQPNAPPDLITIVEKAMAKEPGERYKTAQGLAEDVRKFQTGQLVGAHRYSTAELFRRWLKRHQAAVLVGAGLLVILAGVLAWSFYSIDDALQKAVTQQQIAVKNSEEATKQRNLAETQSDTLLLEQARASAKNEPERALFLLQKLSANFTNWSTARLIAADALSYPLPHFLHGHKTNISSYDISPKGALVSFDDQSLRIWDPVRKESRLTIDKEGAKDSLFTPNGERLVVLDKQNTLSIFELTSGQKLASYQGHENLISRFSSSPDGERIASADEKGHVHLWTSKDASFIQSFQCSSSYIRGVLFSPDGMLLFAVSQGGNACLWDLSLLEDGRPSREPRWTFQNPTGTPLNMGTFFPNQEKVIASSHSSNIILFDVKTGEANYLTGHQNGGLLANAISADGKYFASHGLDRSLKLWDTSTNTAKTLLSGQSFYQAFFHPDGKHLIATSSTGDADNLFCVWLFDLESGRRRLLLQSPKTLLVRLSPNEENVLAIAASGKVLRYWELPIKEQPTLQSWIKERAPTEADLDDNNEIQLP